MTFLPLHAALYNDYADEDIPDGDSDLSDTDISDAVPVEEQAAPPSPIAVSPPDEAAHAGSPSPTPSQSCPLPRKPARFGRRSPPPINVTQIMRLAGGLGLAAAMSCADAVTDSFGTDWQVVSGRVARADEWETSAKLHKSLDLQPKTLRYSHAVLPPRTMPPIFCQLLQM